MTPMMSRERHLHFDHLAFGIGGLLVHGHTAPECVEGGVVVPIGGETASC